MMNCEDFYFLKNFKHKAFKVQMLLYLSDMLEIQEAFLVKTSM